MEKNLLGVQALSELKSIMVAYTTPALTMELKSYIPIFVGLDFVTRRGMKTDNA